MIGRSLSQLLIKFVGDRSPDFHHADSAFSTYVRVGVVVYASKFESFQIKRFYTQPRKILLVTNAYVLRLLYM